MVGLKNKKQNNINENCGKAYLFNIVIILFTSSKFQNSYKVWSHHPKKKKNLWIISVFYLKYFVWKTSFPIVSACTRLYRTASGLKRIHLINFFLRHWPLFLCPLPPFPYFLISCKFCCFRRVSTGFTNERKGEKSKYLFFFFVVVVVFSLKKTFNVYVMFCLHNDLSECLFFQFLQCTINSFFFPVILCVCFKKKYFCFYNFQNIIHIRKIL